MREGQGYIGAEISRDETDLWCSRPELRIEAVASRPITLRGIGLLCLPPFKIQHSRNTLPRLTTHSKAL
jgi:hypothetical protein